MKLNSVLESSTQSGPLTKADVFAFQQLLEEEDDISTTIKSFRETATTVGVLELSFKHVPKYKPLVDISAVGFAHLFTVGIERRAGQQVTREPSDDHIYVTGTGNDMQGPSDPSTIKHLDKIFHRDIGLLEIKRLSEVYAKESAAFTEDNYYNRPTAYNPSAAGLTIDQVAILGKRVRGGRTSEAVAIVRSPSSRPESRSEFMTAVHQFQSKLKASNIVYVSNSSTHWICIYLT